MRIPTILAALALITLAACATPSYSTTSARPSPSELASLGNLSYTMNYTNQTLSYTVTVLTPRPTRTTTHNATVDNDTLRIVTDTTNPSSQQVIVPHTVKGSIDAPRPQSLVVNDDIPSHRGTTTHQLGANDHAVNHEACIALTALLTITACGAPIAQQTSGERNIAYKTAWFNNTPYHLTYNDTTLTYNVSVLSETNYDDAAPNATVQDNTLIIDVINAGGHPGVKPAYYTTPLTGSIQADTPPDTLRITDNASLNNETITLDW